MSTGDEISVVLALRVFAYENVPSASTAMAPSRLGLPELSLDFFRETFFSAARESFFLLRTSKAGPGLEPSSSCMSSEVSDGTDGERGAERDRRCHEHGKATVRPRTKRLDGERQLSASHRVHCANTLTSHERGPLRHRNTAPGCVPRASRWHMPV